jgi:hypothetical protein
MVSPPVVDAVTANQSWSVLEDKLPKPSVNKARASAVARVLFGSISFIAGNVLFLSIF